MWLDLALRSIPQATALVLTLSDGVIAVAVGVVGHVSEQRVVGMRVLGTQTIGVCSSVRAAPPCELAWKVTDTSG